MRQQASGRQRQGATAVEMALAFPFALLFLLGIFEYSRFFMIRNIMINAAREGARFAVIHTYDKTTTDVQNVVAGYLANQQGQLQQFSSRVYATDSLGNEIPGASWNSAAFGAGVGVQIDGDYRPILPKFLLMPATMHLQTVSIMNSEGN
jgi:Flp pilus assembly protein TadG